MRVLRRALACAFLLLVPGCGKEKATPAGESTSAAPEAALRSSVDEPAIATPRPTIVFLGDSLTAGLGLGEEEAFPALVAALLADRGLPVRVINGGVSGDTTAGGLARVDWLLAQKPALVFVALGANDGLRGQSLDSIEGNLRGIVAASRAAGAEVVLGGMKMPPNYGPEYARGFEQLYPRLARELDLPLLPFLLAGVAADPALNQADGIHPTAEGQRRIAVLVADEIEPLVRDLVTRN